MNDEGVQCPKCGAEMFLGAHFCMRCGAQLSDALPEVKLDFSEALAERVENEPSGSELRPAATMSEALARISGVPNFNLDDIDDGFTSLQDGAAKKPELAAAEASASELDAGRAAQRRALAGLTRQLSEQNQAFEASRRGWSREDQEHKRRIQRQREETLARVNIELTELGELPLIARLEKLPFERKLAELERFLDPAQSDRLRFSQASGGQ